MSDIELILNDIKRGFPIVIVDDLTRENEGDLMIAAEKARPETLAFIAREGRGLMCLPTDGTILDRLQIPMSPTNNTDKFSTPFTVSIDARYDINTGVSVNDRMKTISVLLNENSTPDEITYPGHLFPLRPRPNLLKERRGHTEASIQLCKLAGLKPVAVIAEIMNTNGSMAKLPYLEFYAYKFGMKIISIEEIVSYVNDHESI